jgi:hypothetical protein
MCCVSRRSSILVVKKAWLRLKTIARVEKEEKEREEN